MSALTVFNFKNNEIRTVTIDGEPWFVAKDVTDILGLADGRTSIEKLDEDERHTVPVIDSMGREQMMIAVNEPGLYALVLKSRKKEAKAFKRWITHEVLPSIRQTGTYSVKRDPITEIDRLLPAIASGMGVIRQEIESVSTRLGAVEERQKQIDPQEIESRMFVLHKLKKELVEGTKGSSNPVTNPGFWRGVKEHVKVASFQNRAALTVELMDRAIEYARNWCFSRGVQPQTLFDQVTTDERPAV